MFLKRALLGGLMLLGGCHHRLPRMAERGEYEAVVARVEASRFRPKHEAARAYAASLHALGRDRQALDALLLDYRRGGDVRSLVALADLERSLGWRGVAAHHYGRALTHDRDVLEGRREVCALFRERARGYLHAGEGEAADLDMRRVLLMCGGDDPGDVALAAEADAAAQALVDRRIASGECPPPCEPPEDDARAATLETSLQSAQSEGPRAVAERAARDARTLPAEVIVGLLEAEARGALGVPLLGQGTLEAWVGPQSWSELAPAVMSASGPVAAYAQLRLSTVARDMPLAPGSAGARELDRWTEQAVRIPDAAAWRVYASQGDIATAELALASRWRPPRPTVAEGEPAPARVEHWSQRLTIDEGTLEAAVVAARLRKAAGKHDTALRLQVRAFREGAGLSGAEALVRGAAVDALGWGRPWHALALLDTGAAADPSALRAAAATAVVLNRAFCGGSCREDEDLGVVTRVMGEAWVDETRAALLDWSLARRTRPEPTGACPTVAELTEPDTEGALAEALRRTAADPRGPGVGDALTGALAAELRSWCAAPLVFPALVGGEHTVPARRLSDFWSHANEMIAAADLATAAKLAVIAGEPERAVLMAVAAAGEADDPRAVWTDLAEFAAVADARGLQLRALREALMVTPGLEDPAIREQLVLIALGDVAVSWGQDLPQGREATRAHVAEYLDGWPRAQRWHAERALLQRVWAEQVAAGFDEAQRGLLLDALGGREALSERHPRALARLTGEPARDASGPLDVEGLADEATAGALPQVPVVTAALADPRAFEALRVALATSARDWSVRRNMAVSLLVLGSPAGRRVAWQVLRDMAQASRGDAVQALTELVVQRPASLVPKWGRWAAVEPTVVLEGQDNLVRVVLGLDLQAPVVAP